MNVDKERVKKLLGGGVPATNCAAAVGCTVSYISQLMEDQEFAAEVARMQFDDQVGKKEIDDTYEDMEKQLQQKFAQIIPHLSKFKDVAAALKLVNEADKKLKAAPPAGNTGGTTIVTLNLPVVVLSDYVTNQRGEIIEVGGRPMVAQQSNVLLQNLQERRDNRVRERVRVIVDQNSPGTSNRGFEISEDAV